MTTLVVDDDPAIRELVAHTLKRANFSVLTANSGLEAISLLQSHKEQIDLLVTDITMPGMNGLELAKHLTAFGFDIPVLFMSGQSVSPGDEFVSAGFVAKPFVAGALLEEIRRLMLQADSLVIK
jgi:CheY-like chemotaxis protein